MTQRPNVILITCHDLGRHLGCYGVPTVDTPHIDQLAEEGARFANAFCTAPQCSPSRSSIATGRYPHANGVMGLCHGGFKWDLNENETHLVDRLHAVGYHTACLGHVHETRSHARFAFDEALKPLRDHRDDAQAITLARAADAFLEKRANGDKPFFLQLGTFEPHRDTNHPTHFPPTHRPARPEATVPPYLLDNHGAREELAYFEASVRTVDDMVAMIAASLNEHGLADDTLLIFTADHGIPFPRAKCSVYDPGLEVPLILRWPNGPWARGTVHDAMFTGVDFVPTLCDLLELPHADNHQGLSAAPLLRGQPFTPRNEVFAEMTYHDYYDPVRAIRTQTHKLIVAFTFNKGFMDSSQQWFHKTITVEPANPATSRHPLVELYDLRKDPLERENLADDPDHAEVRRDLLRRLNAWMRDTADPLLEGVPMSPMHHEALAALREA